MFFSSYFDLVDSLTNGHNNLPHNLNVAQFIAHSICLLCQGLTASAFSLCLIGFGGYMLCVELAGCELQ